MQAVFLQVIFSGPALRLRDHARMHKPGCALQPGVTPFTPRLCRSRITPGLMIKSELPQRRYTYLMLLIFLTQTRGGKEKRVLFRR